MRESVMQRVESAHNEVKAMDAGQLEEWLILETHRIGCGKSKYLDGSRFAPSRARSIVGAAVAIRMLELIEDAERGQ